MKIKELGLEKVTEERKWDRAKDENKDKSGRSAEGTHIKARVGQLLEPEVWFTRQELCEPAQG